jgi:hypothetical protein
VAGDGVVTGAGLAADAQPMASRPTTIVVAKRASEERIRCPPDYGSTIVVE